MIGLDLSAQTIGSGATSRDSNDLIGPLLSCFYWSNARNDWNISLEYFMERSRMIRRAQNSNRRIVKMTFVLTKAISREPVTHRVSDCKVCPVRHCISVNQM